MQRRRFAHLIPSFVLGVLVPVHAQNLASLPACKGSLLTELRGGIVDPGLVDPVLTESTPVDVDWSLLDGLNPAGGEVLEIRLAHHASYFALFQRREEVEATGGHTWYGTLIGHEGSTFLLARRGNELHGTFHTLDGGNDLLRLWPRGGGRHFVRAYASGVARCGGHEDHTDPATAELGTCNDSPDTIRVLCVATRQAMAAEPSWLTIIQGAVGQLNLDLLSTQASPPLRAVMVGPLIWNYTQSCPAAQNAYTVDLNALAGSTEIAAYRNATQADLVAAFLSRNTNCTGTTAGRAYSIATPSSSYVEGFCVNAINLASDVLPHEVGHTLGACHQSTGSSCGGVSYNEAHEFVSGGSIRRTRMWAEISSAVVPLFSNPNLTMGGISIGTFSHDNARRIREVRQAVANYYRVGDWQLDRTGCRGVIVAGSSNELPELGKTMSLTAVGPYRNAVLFFGYQSMTFAGLSLPLDLAPFGSRGCFLNVSPDLVVGSGPIPFVYNVRLPIDPNLVCWDLWYQVMMYDNLNDPASWGWSQRLRGHIGGLAD